MIRAYLFYGLSFIPIGMFAVCSVVNLIGGGLTMADAALSFAMLATFITLLEYPTGFVAYKKKRKTSVLSGLTAQFIAFAILYLTGTDEVPYPALFLLAFASTLISGADKALITSIFEEEPSPPLNRKDLFFNLQYCSRAGMVIGAILGPYLMNKDTTLVWLACAMGSLTALLFGLFFINDPLKGNTDTKYSGVSALQRKTKPPKATQLKLGILLLSTCFLFRGLEEGFRDIIIQPYILDISKNWVYLLTIHQVVCIGARLAGCYLYKNVFATRDKERLFVFISFGAYAIAQFSAFFTESYLVFGPLMVLAVFTFGWLEPVLDASVESTSGAHNKARIFSFASMFKSAGEASALFIMFGSITDNNYRLFWLFCSGSILVASAFFFFFHLAAEKTTGHEASQLRFSVRRGEI